MLPPDIIDRIIEGIFVGIGLLIGIVLIAYRLRDTLFPHKENKPSTATQELEAIRDQYMELRLEMLRREVEDMRMDITDHDTELKRIKTRPIPPPDDLEND